MDRLLGFIFLVVLYIALIAYSIFIDASYEAVVKTFVVLTVAMMLCHKDKV